MLSLVEKSNILSDSAAEWANTYDRKQSITKAIEFLESLEEVCNKLFFDEIALIKFESSVNHDYVILRSYIKIYNEDNFITEIFITINIDTINPIVFVYAIKNTLFNKKYLVPFKDIYKQKSYKECNEEYNKELMYLAILLRRISLIKEKFK